MARNERTSAPVASIAGKWLAKKLPFDYARDENGDVVDTVKYVMISQREWREIKKVLASAASQTADKRDDRGFDPREGGKIGREFIPKSAQARKALRGKLGKRVTGPARIKSKRPSSWPPSAKPPRRSP